VLLVAEAGKFGEEFAKALPAVLGFGGGGAGGGVGGGVEDHLGGLAVEFVAVEEEAVVFVAGALAGAPGLVAGLHEGEGGEEAAAGGIEAVFGGGEGGRGWIVNYEV
jgi:hypothetical protein